MNQALHRLDTGNTRADEDRRDDGEACTSLRELGAQSERDTERHGSQRVAEIVNQVSQQRDAATRNENSRLSDSGYTEHRERERDGANTLPRALDAVIHKTMRMPVRMVVIVGVRPAPVVVSSMKRRRETNPPKDMAMAAHMRMGMHQ
jgi:hypothetical protein